MQVDTNRKWNREICDQFDKMATRLGEIPDKTRELVELQRYLKASMTETMPVTCVICIFRYQSYFSGQFHDIDLQKLPFLYYRDLCPELVQRPNEFFFY